MFSQDFKKKRFIHSVSIWMAIFYYNIMRNHKTWHSPQYIE